VQRDALPVAAGDEERHVPDDAGRNGRGVDPDDGCQDDDVGAVDERRERNRVRVPGRR
jgi:hypothetical protein